VLIADRLWALGRQAFLWLWVRGQILAQATFEAGPANWRS